MRIGIDIGGSHIGLGLINKTGKIIFKKEEDIDLKNEKNPNKKLQEYIISFINNLLKEAKIKKEKIQSIGIAFPGTISGKYVVKAENLGIKNFNINILEKELGIPIFLRNDAKCAAIAEKEYGNLKIYDDSIFLIVGTGIGGAVFLNRKIVNT